MGECAHRTWRRAARSWRAPPENASAGRLGRSGKSAFCWPWRTLPRSLQKVLFFLPFQFATYAPIRVFLGAYELAGIRLSLPGAVGLQALAAGFMFLLTLGLTRLGLRRFTGVGA